MAAERVKLMSTDEACVLTSDEVLEAYAVDDVSAGLTAAEVAARSAAFGDNGLDEGEDEPLYMKFLDQFKDPMIGLLLGSAALSLLLGHLEDAISISLAVVIVATVAFVQEYRSDKSLEALGKLAPPRCHVIRDGSKQDLEASELVVGDIVSVSVGDRIPADVRFLEAVDLHVDESSLTGEAEAVHKHHEKLGTGARGGAGGSESAKKLSKTTQHVANVKKAKLVDDDESEDDDGENKAVAALKEADKDATIPMAERSNIGFLGTLVRHGRARAVVIAVGENTEIGKVFELVREEESTKTPLQSRMDKLGEQLSYMSFGVIAVIVLIGLYQGRELLEMFQIAVSLAVAAIPEGLPVVVTVTLALGVLRMSKHNAVVKKLPAVEALGCTTVVCVDKTGTLTQNQMTVVKAFTLVEGSPLDVEGTGYSTEGAILTGDGPATVDSHPHLGRLLEAGVVCNHAEVRDGTALGQATEAALIVAAEKIGLQATKVRSNWRHTYERPFSSLHKWMAVRAEPTGDAHIAPMIDPEASLLATAAVKGADAGDSTGVDSATESEEAAHTGGNPRPGQLFFVKGEVGQVLSRCTAVLNKPEGAATKLTPSLHTRVMSANSAMASEGLRVIAIASGPVMPNPATKSAARGGGSPERRGLTFLGLVGIMDPPRDGVRESIETLHGSGVRVTMITGDALETAFAIGKNLGLCHDDDDPTSVGMSGDQIEALAGDERLLAQKLRKHEDSTHNVKLFYRTAPKHKMAIVRAYQSLNEVVAMTGDGVNDAPALKAAHIGVAMGKSGTDVAKEAADMILLDDNFATLLPAVEEGKCIYLNCGNFVRFQLSTSIAALCMVAVASLMGLPNPLNAMQVLWINIIMDGPPAQSLGVEPVDPDVMRGPPMDAKKPVVSGTLLKRVFSSAALVCAGTLWVFAREMEDNTLSARDTTMAFTTFVLFDLFNALSCRSEGKSIFTIGLFSNTFFLVACGASLAGQLAVIYFPPLQSIFQTEALSLADWQLILALTSSVFWIDELRKLIFAPKPPVVQKVD